MPTYEFKCNDCDTTFDAIHSVSEPHPTHCVLCGSTNIYQVYYAPHAQILGEAKTVGTLAEQNAKRLSAEQKAQIEATHREDVMSDKLKEGMEIQKTKPEKPWYKKKSKTTTKDISRMTDKQKKNYIMTGNKNG